MNLLDNICTVVLLSLIGGLISCKPSVPREFLQPDEMGDILYDYHLVECMANDQKLDSFDMITYKTAILQKHHCTETEFDQSLSYYMRHTQQLHGIYEHLSERLNNEALAQGISINELNHYGDAVSEGDTANVWRGEPALICMPDVPYNYYSYEAKVDSSYHEGDRLILDFDALFIQRDGAKKALALLSVRLMNDSVITRTLHLSSNTHYTMQIEDKQRLGIKDIRGFFLYHRNEDSSVELSSTVKLLLISGIRLVRMHTAEEVSAIQSSPISIGHDTLRKLTDSAQIPAIKIPNQKVPAPKTGGRVPVERIQGAIKP